MATVTGLTNLKVAMKSIPIDLFKVKVKNFVNSMNSFKSLFMKVQQAKLVNPYLKDNKTDYPHIRSGNLMRNLIDLKMDRFKESNFVQTTNNISYTFETTNSYSVKSIYRLGKDGSKFYYAKYLNDGGKRTSRYRGYFGRLQMVFRNNFLAKFRELKNAM